MVDPNSLKRKTRIFDRLGKRFAAARIALVYVVLALLWIHFSDYFAETIAGGDTRFLTRIEDYKGTAFVLVTGLLLFALIESYTLSIRRTGKELAAVIEGIADGVFVVDLSGAIVNVNGAFLDILGETSRKDLPDSVPALGLKYHLRDVNGSVIAPDRTPVVRALKGETVRSYHAVVVRRDGKERAISITSAPIRSRTGKIIMAVEVVRDISEVRRLDSMRDEFLSTAAHELKTPVSVIKAYAQLLHGEAGAAASKIDCPPRAHDAKTQARVYEAINRQCDRISRLIQELLEVSRLDLMQAGLERSNVDLIDLTRDVVERMQRLTVKHELVVNRKNGADLTIQGDRDRLEQVVVNLVDNAIRFSPHGGRVELDVSGNHDSVEIAVRDFGVGIPASRQSRVMERYYRAHAGMAYDYGGMGVGLNISQEIVHRHGGNLWFESEEGKGSVFGFRIPRSPGKGTS